MPQDHKHIISDLEDAVKGIIDTVQTQLTGVVASGDVVLAFKDERPDVNVDRAFPRATVHLYDFRSASGRRHAGDLRTHTYNSETGEAVITLKPIPVDLLFQIDTYALTHETDWAIKQKMLPWFDVQSQPKITTDAGREFYLAWVTWQPLDEIETENWFRTAWRCRAEVWFGNPKTPPASPYVVLQRKLIMLAETWTMDAAP